MTRIRHIADGVMPPPAVVTVIEQTDTFGRREFDWENVPSKLIDDNASVGGRIVLNRPELKEFLDVRFARPGSGFLGRLFHRG